jgi:hypothetical protein
MRLNEGSHTLTVNLASPAKSTSAKAAAPKATAHGDAK